MPSSLNSKKMKKEVKIGLFTIAIIICAWSGLRFLSGTDILGKDSHYYAHYDQIDGIQKASAIYIKGVKVGMVSDVILKVDDSAEVYLKLSISNKYRIPKDSQAKIYNTSIMGPRAIELALGSSSEYLESGDEILTGRDLDLFDMADSELGFLKERIEHITDDLSQTLSGINTLLVGNTEHIGALIANLESLSSNLNALVSQNQDNVEQTLSGFATISQTLADNSQQIDSIIKSVSSMTSDLNDAQIGTALKGTLDGVNSLLSTINRSEGNMGKLIHDEMLYENITSATAGLDSLLFDLKENPSRYVHFSLFGSNEQRKLNKAEKKVRKATKQ